VLGAVYGWEDPSEGRRLMTCVCELLRPSKVGRSRAAVVMYVCAFTLDRQTSCTVPISITAGVVVDAVCVCVVITR